MAAAIATAGSDTGTRLVRVWQLPLTSRIIVMKRFLCAAFAIVWPLTSSNLARADDTGANAVLDKAIKAMGGEEKLKNAGAITWKSNVAITFNDNTSQFTSHATLKDLDHYRSEIDGDFGGNPVKGVVVINGEKGWRMFGENKMELDGDALANEKRRVYLQVIPTVLIHLKGKGFKLESAGEAKVDDRPAAGIKITGPDSKEFTLYFDKDSGLPVKLVAKVVGFDNEEFSQETTLRDYKDFDGVKKATKADSKRNGEDFVKSELTEFKVLDKVDPKSFSEPE